MIKASCVFCEAGTEFICDWGESPCSP